MLNSLFNDWLLFVKHTINTVIHSTLYVRAINSRI